MNPEKDTVANMAAKATRMALERAKLTEKDIEFIVLRRSPLTTSFRDQVWLLQRELGLESIGAPRHPQRVLGIYLCPQHCRSVH